MKLVSLFCVLVLLVLSPAQTLAQGNGPDADGADQKIFLPMIGKNANRYTEPGNPLDLTVTLDSARQASATVPLSGGTLSATAADGTVFTLVVPDDALLEETKITLTPVTSVSGLPGSINFVAGVDLEPDGLRFFQPATLTVQRPAGQEVPADREVAFASQAEGKDAYLYPLALAPRTPTFQLMHFTLTYLGDGIWRDLSQQRPVSDEARLAHEMSKLIAKERAALLNNQPGDPDFWTKVEALMREYYNVVLLPLVGTMRTNCKAAHVIAPKVVGWMRQVQLFNFQTFDAESDHLSSSLEIANINCWNEATTPCLNWHDQDQVSEAFAAARMDQILYDGVHELDPFAVPACTCTAGDRIKAGWFLQMSFQYEYEQRLEKKDGAYEYTHRVRSANVTGRLDQRESGVWRGFLSGSTTYLDRDEDQSDAGYFWSTASASGSPRAEDRVGAPVTATLYLDTKNCEYTIWVPVRIDAPFSDNAGTSFTADEVVANLQVYNFPMHWLIDTKDFTVTATRTVWPNDERQLVRMYMPMLTQLTGPYPDVTVTWTFWPIAPPSPTAAEASDPRPVSQ